jgi:hypothetical protein
MADSILTSTKAALGVPESHEAFDTELILHINSVLSRLNALGLGPTQGFRITDKTSTWEEFLGSEYRLDDAKSYMYLRVKLLFDPPDIGFVITAIKEQIQEEEWRLTNRRDDINDESLGLVVDGGTPSSGSGSLVLDGGAP